MKFRGVLVALAIASVAASAQDEVRDLTRDELSKLRSQAARTAGWLQRYPTDRVSPGEISPAVLDRLWYEWRSDPAADKPSDKEAIEVFGAAFGQVLSSKLGMRWVEVTNEYGRDFCCRGGAGDITVCPRSVVHERVQSGSLDFFRNLYNLTKQMLRD